MSSMFFLFAAMMMATTVVFAGAAVRFKAIHSAAEDAESEQRGSAELLLSKDDSVDDEPILYR